MKTYTLHFSKARLRTGGPVVDGVEIPAFTFKAKLTTELALFWKQLSISKCVKGDFACAIDPKDKLINIYSETMDAEWDIVASVDLKDVEIGKFKEELAYALNKFVFDELRGGARQKKYPAVECHWSTEFAEFVFGALVQEVEPEKCDPPHVFEVGDKSSAICYKCGVVSTTFQVRDVPLSGTPEVVVTDLLVGCCDSCGSVVSTPPQSSPQIQKAILAQKNAQ